VLFDQLADNVLFILVQRIIDTAVQMPLAVVARAAQTRPPSSIASLMNARGTIRRKNTTAGKKLSVFPTKYGKFGAAQLILD
jgi:type IV secretory pathway VirB3-like protein